MSPVKVTFGELGAAAGNIQSSSSKISAEIDDIISFVNQLAATWTGEAQDSYRVQQDKLNTASTELNSVLAQIGVAVNTANDNYQTAERSNASRFA